MDVAERLKLEIDTGALLILQRVSPGLSSEALADQLSSALGSPVEAVIEPFTDGPGPPRLLDARSLPPGAFHSWEPRRAELALPDAPLIVLLDVASGRRLLREAPHVATWAGGVRMPPEPTVRPAETAQERRLGRNALSRAQSERPELADRWDGQTLGVAIGSDRLFFPSTSASALQQARAEMDEGILYLHRLGDPDDDELD